MHSQIVTYHYWESGDYSLNCAVPLILTSVSCKHIELTCTVYQIWKGKKSSLLGRTCLKLTARPLCDSFGIGRSNLLYEQSQLFTCYITGNSSSAIKPERKIPAR
uniref:Uncharacterized protein n=1 Tax=Micrurus carvalhoi TaxID=3147026 RepID=A0A2H6N0J8_9SAUR